MCLCRRTSQVACEVTPSLSYFLVMQNLFPRLQNGDDMY